MYVQCVYGSIASIDRLLFRTNWLDAVIVATWRVWPYLTVEMFLFRLKRNDKKIASFVVDYFLFMVYTEVQYYQNSFHFYTDLKKKAGQ